MPRFVSRDALSPFVRSRPGPQKLRLQAIRSHVRLFLYSCDETNYSAARMSSHKIQVRRATLEDLPKLIALWQKEFLPWETLEKRFTEFQIAETLDGEMLAVAGLQASGKEGKLHSEVILRSEEGDAVRAKFLERFQTLATNRGIFRIWTQLNAPFWA